MIDLIGRPYELGADGSNGPIDCIHLVYTVLERLRIPTPAFDPLWYEGDRMRIGRALLEWGTRIPAPTYDGDVVLFRQSQLAFAVTWQSGILYINQDLRQVAWCRIAAMPASHCFRTKSR